MRLLNVHSLTFRDFYSQIPPYAIASHRWDIDTEATLEDVRQGQNTEKAGYKKVEDFAEYIRTYLTPRVEWLWIDTCCINQDSDRELGEAIRAMFKWYRNAEVCLAYLVDVGDSEDLDSFKNSVWFRRGWTLQELLAPSTVVFLTKAWHVIGHKGQTGRSRSGLPMASGQRLTSTIALITGIPEQVLDNFDQNNEFTVEERAAWMAGRETTREEDIWYSLMGIFDVSMDVRYEEGGEKARRRLLEEIRKQRIPLDQKYQELSAAVSQALKIEQTSRITTTSSDANATSSTISSTDAWEEPALTRARKTFALARTNYSCGNITAARKNSNQALDELSQIRRSSENALRELMLLFGALIEATSGGSADREKSLDTLASVEIDDLELEATSGKPSPLVLERMVVICWIWYRLQETVEAERCGHNLIDNVVDWSGDMAPYYDLNVLLALIAYSQHNGEKGHSLVRVIPQSYLKDQYDEIIRDKSLSKNNLSLLDGVLEAGCEAAAIHSAHYGPFGERARLAVKAANKGALSQLAMLVACDSTDDHVDIITTFVCCVHEAGKCQDKNFRKPGKECSHQSPWLGAAQKGNLAVMRYMLDELKKYSRSQPSDDLLICMEKTIQLDNPDVFSLLSEWVLENTKGVQGWPPFEYPIHLAVSHGAKNTVQYLLRSERTGTINKYLEADSRTLTFRPSTIDNRIMLTPVQHAVMRYTGFAGNADGPRINEQQKENLLEMIRSLVSGGADFMESRKLEHNCVHIAVAKDAPKLLDCFLNFEGVTFVNRSYRGITLLRGILQLPYRPSPYLAEITRTIQFLIANGADPMTCDEKGQTCFHLALLTRYPLRFLKALGKSTHPIDFSRKDKEGKTVVDVAKEWDGPYGLYTDCHDMSSKKARQLILATLQEISPSAFEPDFHRQPRMSLIDRFKKSKT